MLVKGVGTGSHASACRYTPGTGCDGGDGDDDDGGNGACSSLAPVTFLATAAAYDVGASSSSLSWSSCASATCCFLPAFFFACLVFPADLNTRCFRIGNGEDLLLSGRLTSARPAGTAQHSMHSTARTAQLAFKPRSMLQSQKRDNRRCVQGAMQRLQECTAWHSMCC